MKTATLSLSLDNEALYRGCAIEEVGGRLVPEYACTRAINVVGRSAPVIVDAVLTMEAKIVFAGGDDLFFTTTLTNYREEKLRALMHEFSRRTECYISFGVGPTIEAAFINLRLAKANGQGSLVASSLT